jgi:very-short-patch-repair endonuclease
LHRGAERARSAAEAFLYRRLETLPETKGRFRVNAALPIAFDGLGKMEVDLLCADARVAVELDGAQHLADPVALPPRSAQGPFAAGERYLVLRFLAEDVGKELDTVLDAISIAVSTRRGPVSTTAPLNFARRART